MKEAGVVENEIRDEYRFFFEGVEGGRMLCVYTGIQPDPVGHEITGHLCVCRSE